MHNRVRYLINMGTYAVHTGASGCSSCKESKQTEITDGSTASMFTVLLFKIVLVWRIVLCIKETPNEHTEDWFLTNCFSFTLAQENHDALIKSLVEDRRFDDKKSAAACIVYKSLLHWHSFEAEKTNIFDRIIQTIRSSVEVVNPINMQITLPFPWYKNYKCWQASYWETHCLNLIYRAPKVLGS